MDEFDEWLADCYRLKEISKEEIETALFSEIHRKHLWDEFQESFAYYEKQEIVHAGLTKILDSIDKN